MTRKMSEYFLQRARAVGNMELKTRANCCRSKGTLAVCGPSAEHEKCYCSKLHFTFVCLVSKLHASYICVGGEIKPFWDCHGALHPALMSQ